MPKRLDELTIVEARSLALAAQGFDKRLLVHSTLHIQLMNC